MIYWNDANFPDLKLDPIAIFCRLRTAYRWPAASNYAVEAERSAIYGRRVHELDIEPAMRGPIADSAVEIANQITSPARYYTTSSSTQHSTTGYDQQNSSWWKYWPCRCDAVLANLQADHYDGNFGLLWQSLAATRRTLSGINRN